MIAGLYNIMDEIIEILRAAIDSNLYNYKIMIGRYEELRDEYAAKHFIGIFYDDDKTELIVDSNLISGDVFLRFDVVSDNTDKGRACFDVAAIIMQTIHNRRIESQVWTWDGQAKRIDTDETHIGYTFAFKSLFAFDT